jgi:hypothetical protein
MQTECDHGIMGSKMEQMQPYSGMWVGLMQLLLLADPS